MDDSGVLSVDMVFAVFFTLLVLGFLMMAASVRMDLVNENQALLEIRMLMDETASYVNIVSAGGQGHEITFELPLNLNQSSEYHLEINSTGVYGFTGGYRGSSMICPVTVVDRYGNPSRVRLNPGKRYSIRNILIKNRTAVMVCET